MDMNNTDTTTTAARTVAAFFAHQDAHPQFPLSAHLVQFASRTGQTTAALRETLALATHPAVAPAVARLAAEVN